MALLASGAAFAADSATVPGNVGGWVSKAQRVGTAPAGDHVTVVLHMALRNPERLQALVEAVSSPKSPQYGKYLTQAGFRSRFAPDPADVSAAADLLRNAGMKAVTVGPAGSYVSAEASVAQLQATFGVSQNLYDFHGRAVRANSELPSIPAALAGKVLAIEGLDASNTRHPNHVSVTQGERVAPQHADFAHEDDTPTVTPPPVAAALPSPYCDTYAGDLKAELSTAPAPYSASLPWLICGYTPQQVRQAYGLNHVPATGAGVTVVIVDAYASPTLMADGNAYAANHNLPALTAAEFFGDHPAGHLQPAGLRSDHRLWLVGRGVARPGRGARRGTRRQHRLCRLVGQRNVAERGAEQRHLQPRRRHHHQQLQL